MGGNSVQGPVRTAPLSIRLIAGLMDLAPVAAITAGIVSVWYGLNPVELPPRYWNHFDYMVDIVNNRPDLTLPPVFTFVIVFIAWETIFGMIIGHAPFARVFGMRVFRTGGKRPGSLRLAARALLALAGSIFAFIGPMLSLIVPHRRMLHDILTGCLVLLGTNNGDDIEQCSTAAAGSTYKDGPRR